MPNDSRRSRAPLRRALAAAGCAVLLPACGAVPVVTSPHPTTAPAPAAASGSADPHLTTVLRDAWTGYKKAFIRADGRVVDPTRGGITTSEAQSYALLRAVWMNDRAGFDQVWQWTTRNLQVRDDRTFASLWGNGSVQDRNSAADADSDIALALLYAGRRFGSSQYTGAGRAVLAGMWQADVVSIGGMHVLTAGSWATAQQSPGPVLNPSYFAPYAYRTFAREDPAHPWSSLVDSAYTLLGGCTAATLDGTVSAGLPPNWCAIDRASGQLVSFSQISGCDNFGYDAFRVMWRVAVDGLWNREPRARDYLSRHDFLRRRWAAAQRLDPVYAHDGAVIAGYDDPTVYGGDIGSFLLDDAAAAAQIEQRILASYQPAAPAHFGQANNYFEQNWAWFGLALASGVATDLDGG